MEVRIREDYNIYLPGGVVVVDPEANLLVAAYSDLRCAGVYRSWAEAFTHLGPAGLIPHTTVRRVEDYNRLVMEKVRAAGFKWSIGE